MKQLLFGLLLIAITISIPSATYAQAYGEGVYGAGVYNDTVSHDTANSGSNGGSGNGGLPDSGAQLGLLAGAGALLLATGLSVYGYNTRKSKTAPKEAS